MVPEYIMVFKMVQILHSDVISVYPTYTWPYDRFEPSADEVTFCDARGILCFSSGLSRFTIYGTELYHLRAIVFTYTVSVGPYVPLYRHVGDFIPYDIAYGHFVSTVYFKTVGQGPWTYFRCLPEQFTLWVVLMMAYYLLEISLLHCCYQSL